MTEEKLESNETELTEMNKGTEEGKRPFIDLPARWDRWEPIAEVIATIILAFTTLATAWSGYQSARWGGVQASSYSQAGALRTESTRASTSAGQLVQVDISIFTNWLNAYAEGNQPLVDFYQERFRDEFKPAFDAWLATDPANNPDAPASPFAMEEYNIQKLVEAEELEKQAEEKFAEGSRANQTSDNYVLNTVILASVLFLIGIQSRLRSIPLRSVVLLIGFGILLFGIINIITYPVN